MLFVYLMLVAVGYVVGRVHAVAIRWAMRRPALVLPPLRPRQPSPIRGVDVRDQVQRLGEPPSFEPGGSDVD